MSCSLVAMKESDPKTLKAM